MNGDSFETPSLGVPKGPSIPGLYSQQNWLAATLTSGLLALHFHHLLLHEQCPFNDIIQVHLPGTATYTLNTLDL